jgi:hypothetical protein
MSYLGNSFNTQPITPATDFFSGNGVTTIFTLTRPVQSNYSIEVVVNNVQQNPSNTYTINASNQIVFVAAPSTGVNNIYVVYNSTTAQNNGVGQGTVGTQQLGSVSNINSIGSNLSLQTNGTNAITVDQNQNIVLGPFTSTGYRIDVRGGTIGQTSGTQYSAIQLTASDTPVSNTDFLQITNTRTATGPSWTTRGWRLQQRVDATHMGWMQFNGSGNTAGISFGTGATTTSPTAVPEVARIDSVGRLTVPNMPFVSFYPSGILSTTLGSADGSVFVQLTTANYLTLVDQVGGHWNGSAFTCPVAGMYQVSISGIKYPQAGVLHVDLRVNNVGYAGGNARNRAEETATYCQFGSTYILRCAAGDALTWWAFGAAGWHPGHGVWSIRLVG